MSGCTPDNAAVAANVITMLGTHLRGKPCRVYSSDLRVRVLATGLGTYPDVTVICGTFERDPEDPRGNTAANPRVLVEVLSPSTEEYDRGEKLDHYRRIGSVTEIVLIGHESRRVEVWSRDVAGAWFVTVTQGDEIATLPSLGCDLPLADVYRDPLATRRT